jgi:hypothetical protein
LETFESARDRPAIAADAVRAENAKTIEDTTQHRNTVVVIVSA